MKIKVNHLLSGSLQGYTTSYRSFGVCKKTGILSRHGKDNNLSYLLVNKNSSISTGDSSKPLSFQWVRSSLSFFVLQRDRISPLLFVRDFVSYIFLFSTFLFMDCPTCRLLPFGNKQQPGQYQNDCTDSGIQYPLLIFLFRFPLHFSFITCYNLPYIKLRGFSQPTQPRLYKTTK